MLLEHNLDEQEQQKTQMWELFADLMNLDHPDNYRDKFTAKELTKELNYTKSDLNKYLFRLYTNKALKIQGKAPNGATIYSINITFLSGEPTE